MRCSSVVGAFMRPVAAAGTGSVSVSQKQSTRLKEDVTAVQQGRAVRHGKPACEAEPRPALIFCHKLDVESRVFRIQESNRDETKAFRSRARRVFCRARV